MGDPTYPICQHLGRPKHPRQGKQPTSSRRIHGIHAGEGRKEHGLNILNRFSVSLAGQCRSPVPICTHVHGYPPNPRNGFMSRVFPVDKHSAIVCHHQSCVRDMTERVVLCYALSFTFLCHCDTLHAELSWCRADEFPDSGVLEGTRGCQLMRCNFT